MLTKAGEEENKQTIKERKEEIKNVTKRRFGM
jgi:hypothetical protein